MSSSKKTTLLQHPTNTNATANQALFIFKGLVGAGKMRPEIGDMHLAERDSYEQFLTPKSQFRDSSLDDGG